MEKIIIPLLAVVLLFSGCVATNENNQANRDTTLPLSVGATVQGTDQGVVFVGPENEFAIDVNAMSANDAQETISLLADENVEFLDSNQFEANITSGQEWKILKTVRLKINSKGYHKIQIEASPTYGSRNFSNYGIGSFHACVVDNLDEAREVCSDFNPSYIDNMLNNKGDFPGAFLVD